MNAGGPSTGRLLGSLEPRCAAPAALRPPHARLAAAQQPRQGMCLVTRRLPNDLALALESRAGRGRAEGLSSSRAVAAF
jgi:hypothetical protein